MDIIVLGAGVIGVTTAYCLVREGHSVTVVDRQPAAGLETSFANGSQLVAHGVGPWSAPGVPRNLIKWLGREDAPLLLRLSAIPGLWKWGPQFLLNCTAHRWQANARSIHHLATASMREFVQILSEQKIAFDELQKGILVVHRDRSAFEQARESVERDKAVGMDKVAIGASECVSIEPALGHLRGQIAGGIYSKDDRTGDCLKFTQALASAAEVIGVKFVYGRTVKSIISDGKIITGIQTDKGLLQSQAYVLAFGSYSPLLLGRVGVRLPIYPVKGYSVTVSTNGWNGAPSVSLIDEKRKFGFTRLGDRLRMAGTAEFGGYSTAPSERRSEMLLEGLREMFPDFPDTGPPVQWTGLRPMTPDGVPIVGKTPLSNLFVNSGHGTLGWSLASGSARLLCDILANRKPDVDPDLYSLRRFG